MVSVSGSVSFSVPGTEPEAVRTDVEKRIREALPTDAENVSVSLTAWQNTPAPEAAAPPAEEAKNEAAGSG